MVSSTVPRLELRWPPVRETLSSTKPRSSLASAGNCWRVSCRRSAGDSMEDSRELMVWASVVSVRTAADPVGQAVQESWRWQAAAVEGAVSPPDHLVRVGLRGIQTHQGHIGGLVGGGVLAGGLAQGLGIGGDVEHVVHHLKGQ